MHIPDLRRGCTPRIVYFGGKSVGIAEPWASAQGPHRMKRFLVCDEIGNAVFVDNIPGLEPERASMMCLPFATAQSMLQEAFGQRFATVRYADGTIFVFSQMMQTEEDYLFFMVSSSDGDSVPFLRRQLQLLSEMILFKFGPNVNVRFWRE